MRLSELVTREVITIEPIGSLNKAISLMEEHNIHHLPVVHDEHPVGMVSDRDLLLTTAWRLNGDRTPLRAAGSLRVVEVMSVPVVTARPTVSVTDAAALMVEHHIGAIVIIHHDSISGIITRLDLLAHAGDLAQEALFSALRDIVARHMRARVFSIRSTEFIHTAAALMHEKHLRHIPVIDDETLLGMLADRDIRRALATERTEDEEAQEAGLFYAPRSIVMEIMTTPVITITEEQTLTDAARLMTEHRIHSLPVVRDKTVVGMLTDSDILRVVAHSGYDI